jgi:hypothetical protein
LRTNHAGPRATARVIRVVAVLLATLATGIIAAPTASQASPTATFPAPIDRSDPDNLTSTVPVNIYAGDCVGWAGSSVWIHKPDVFGNTFLTWHQWAFTKHTNNYDQWHITFYLLTVDGFGSIYTIPQLHGDKMYHADQVYEWTKNSEIFHLDANVQSRLNYVSWQSQC